MRIAVNSRCLTNANYGAGYYTYYLFHELVRQHSGHEYFFITDAPLKIELNSNVKVVVSGKQVSSRLSHRKWLNKTVKNEIKKLKADVFISLDGTGCRTTHIPQILGFPDLKFLNKGNFWKRIFTRNSFEANIKHASVIVTVSDAVKQELTSKFNVGDKQTVIVSKAPRPIFKPIAFEEKEQIKSQLSDGKEFFIFPGGFDPNMNLLEVLKAFSLFKKWQQSEMKLIVTGNIVNDPGGMMQKVETFKFKDDVVLAGKLEPEKFAPVLAASYALIYTNRVYTFGMPVLEAMKSGTAVICSDASAATDFAGDAVLKSNEKNAEGLSQQMIHLYKDEEMRSRLVKKGLAHAEKFDWKSSADVLWKLINEISAKAG